MHGLNYYKTILEEIQLQMTTIKRPLADYRNNSILKDSFIQNQDIFSHVNTSSPFILSCSPALLSSVVFGQMMETQDWLSTKSVSPTMIQVLNHIQNFKKNVLIII